MDQQVQKQVREAITTTYELMQDTRSQHHDELTQALRALEDRLKFVESRLGGPDREHLGPIDLSEELSDIRALLRHSGMPLTDQVKALVRNVHRLEGRISRFSSREIASQPLLGVLPVARVIPQDVHSVMDYASGIKTAASGAFARSTEAKVASAVLGASAIGVAAMTDYRLSVKKVIPIETHQVIDIAWGATAIAAPFALGYLRKDPLTAAVHIATGVFNVVTAFFTDYRAATGVGRPGWR